MENNGHIMVNGGQPNRHVPVYCRILGVLHFIGHVDKNFWALSVPVDPLPLPPSGSASMSSNTAVESPSLNGPVSPSSLAITKAEPFDIVADTFLERAANEGLAIIQSPRVGFFRRARTIKGKRAPAACKEKQVVKEGQVICYIEQLGGEIPVESDISGEVTKFLCSDGEPVGYGDAIIAILPSFPGIKKLQLEG